MQTKDRKLLLTLSIVLLVAWFVGDFLLGAAVGDLQRQSKQDAVRQARADSNRHMMGGNSGYNGGSRSMGPLELASFHETIRLPLRYAAAAGLLLFLAFGPVVQWVRNLPQHFVQKPRLVVGMILIAVAIAIFAGAQVIASSHSTSFTQTRPITGAALEADRRQRTMVNPPSHLNPNPRAGKLTSITYGADPTETVTSSEIDASVIGYVLIARLVAAVIGCVGLVYTLLGAQSNPANGAQPAPTTKSPLENSKPSAG
jgi:hypothetical protein